MCECGYLGRPGGGPDVCHHTEEYTFTTGSNSPQLFLGLFLAINRNRFICVRYQEFSVRLRPSPRAQMAILRRIGYVQLLRAQTLVIPFSNTNVSSTSGCGFASEISLSSHSKNLALMRAGPELCGNPQLAPHFQTQMTIWHATHCESDALNQCSSSHIGIEYVEPACRETS